MLATAVVAGTNSLRLAASWLLASLHASTFFRWKPALILHGTAFRFVGMLRSATPLMFRTAAARGFSAGRTLKETDTEVFELLQKECKRQVDAPAERASLVLVP